MSRFLPQKISFKFSDHILQTADLSKFRPKAKIWFAPDEFDNKIHYQILTVNQLLWMQASRNLLD